MNTGTRDNIDATIKHLEAVELKLLAIDEEDLDNEARNKLAQELDECSVNLMALRNAALASLTAEFRSNEEELRTAAGALEQNLQRIGEAVEVINTVAAGLGLISRIVRLV